MVRAWDELRFTSILSSVGVCRNRKSHLTLVQLQWGGCLPGGGAGHLAYCEKFPDHLPLAYQHPPDGGSHMSWGYSVGRTASPSGPATQTGGSWASNSRGQMTLGLSWASSAGSSGEYVIANRPCGRGRENAKQELGQEEPGGPPAGSAPHSSGEGECCVAHNCFWPAGW